MLRPRRDLLGICLMLTALALAGCAEPTPTLTTVAAPDLTGVTFDIHQEPG